MKNSIFKTLKVNSIQRLASVILLFGCIQTYAQTVMN
jgi:hypothetical protein